MRAIALTAAVFALLWPGFADAAISCSEIPKAQSFVSGLRPGPNTRAAQRHLDAAKAASSPAQCARELHKVDIYARRSAAADPRLAVPSHRRMATLTPPRKPVLCADMMHQNRPGGTDYRGPAVAGCPVVRR